MKRAILYSSVAVILIAVVLLESGLFYVGISPYAHYQLNEDETRVVGNAISQFREKVENGKFDEIQKELVENQRNENFQNATIKKIKEAREKFGEPLSMEFFRAMTPETASKYYKNVDGIFYTLFYFTKAEKGEYAEHFEWIVKENGEAKLLSYSGQEMKDWEVKSREREKYINEKYPRETKIPFGSRFIEIRY